MTATTCSCVASTPLSPRRLTGEGASGNAAGMKVARPSAPLCRRIQALRVFSHKRRASHLIGPGHSITHHISEEHPWRVLDQLLRDPEADEHEHLFPENASRDLSVLLVTPVKLQGLKCYMNAERRMFSEFLSVHIRYDDHRAPTGENRRAEFTEPLSGGAASSPLVERVERISYRLRLRF